MVCGIWGSHSRSYEGFIFWDISSCSALKVRLIARHTKECWQGQTYFIQPWRSRQHATPKHWYLSTNILGVTTQNWVRWLITSWTIEVRIMAQSRNLPFAVVFVATLTSHPISHRASYLGAFPLDKAAESWSWPSISIWCRVLNSTICRHHFMQITHKTRRNKALNLDSWRFGTDGSGVNQLYQPLCRDIWIQNRPPPHT
jgi:hypothetical protein